MGLGKYDLVLIQPIFYVQAYEQYGFLPLARNGEDLSAYFVVRPDSTLQSLDDARGMTMSLPPFRAAVSYLAREALKKEGLKWNEDLRLRYHPNHDTCLQTILIGKSAICGTALTVLRNYESRHKVTFRILAVSRPIPHILFAVHPRVPEQERKRLLEEILGWGKTKNGLAFLQSAGLKPFIPATNEQYDTVRELIRNAQ